MVRFSQIFSSSLICLVLLAGCDGGAGLSDEQLISRAEVNREKGDLKAAVIDLKTVLQGSPKNAEARQTLGSLYLEIGDGQAADKELRLALEHGIEEQDVLPILARALLLQQDFQGVLELKHHEKFNLNNKLDLYVTRGLAFLALDQKEVARQSIQAAIGIDENSTYALFGKARLLAVEGKPDDSRQLLEKVFQIDAQYGDAWSFLGDIERFEGNLEQAEAAYTKAIENKTVHYGELLNRGIVRIGQKRLDQAQHDIDQLRKTIKEHPGIDYVQGLIHFGKKAYKDAQTAFENVLKFQDDHWQAILYAGMAHYMQGNHVAAEGYLTRYVANNPGDNRAKQALGSIKLNNRNFVEAEKLARSVVEEDEMDVLALALLANALLAQDKVSEGVDALQKVVSIQPESAPSRVDLGLGLLRYGEKEAAITELKTAIELDPEFNQASIKLILTHLKNKAYDDALEAAIAYQKRSPDEATAPLLLGMVYMARGEPENASRVFLRVLELDPGNTSANSGLAAIALQAKQLDKAKGYYLNALEKHPGDLKTLINLASVEVAQENTEAMKHALETAISHNPEALQPRLILGRAYLREERTDKAFGLLSGMAEKYPKSLPLLALLTEGQIKSKDYTAAKLTLDRFIELDSSNPIAHYSLARVNAALGDNEGYRGALKKTLELDSNHIDARKGLVEIMLRSKETESAGQHIKILKEQTDNRADILVLEGGLHEVMGDSSGAITLYQEAFNKARNNIHLIRLTSAQWNAGERESVVKRLADWVNEHPDDGITRFELANRYLLLGQNAEAIEEFKEVIKLLPKNTVALNNLAWLLRDTNPTEALPYAQEAVALAPQSGELKDTLAMVLLSKGDLEQAARVIDKAIDRSPNNPTIRYHRAEILNKSGNSTSARQELTKLLEQYETFPEKDEAQKLLDTM